MTASTTGSSGGGGLESYFALSRLTLAMSAFFVAAATGLARRIKHSPLGNVRRAMEPFVSKSDLMVFLFLLVVWILLYLYCTTEGDVGSSFFVEAVTSPISAGLLWLESLRPLLLVLPDLVSPNSVHFPSSSERITVNPDYDEMMQRLLSNVDFQDQVRKMTREQLQPWREELMSSSAAAIEELRVSVTRGSEKHRESGANELQNRMAEMESSLEDKLTRSLKMVEEDHTKAYSDLRTEKSRLERLLNDRPTAEEVRTLNAEIGELERKIQVVSTSLQESQAVMQRCCKARPEGTDASAAVAPAIIADWVKQITQNSSFQAQGFNRWLESKFVSKEDMEHLQKSIAQELSSTTTNQGSRNYTSSSMAHSSELNINRIIQNALNVYDADKTGMFDFALESAGGTIASTRCTESYDTTHATYSVFGIPFWWEHNTPRTILQPGASPGQCWAFKGSLGSVVVRLSSAIHPTAVSVEHISKLVAPNLSISSAPKELAILGLRSLDDDSPLLLGNFTYSDNGLPVQTFFLKEATASQAPFELIELKVLSNHGNVVYTCLYRFRVHGNLPDDTKV